MNSIARFLTVAGIGLVAGMSVGAGPAQAATVSGHDGTHRAVASSKAHWNDDDNDIIGYFDSPMRCERVGRFGEMRNRWDDYDCYRVRRGFHRGDWALEVTYDRFGGGFGGHHGGGGFSQGSGAYHSA